MLVTTIPSALDRGAVLVHHARAERFTRNGNTISGLTCTALDRGGQEPTSRRITVTAKAYVSSSGAIGTPALLLRSEVPDTNGRIGIRTFLHPVVLTVATMPDEVDPFSGAPQSIYSDHFLKTNALDGPIGFKLEVPPVHPLLAGVTLQGFGPAGAALMANLAYSQAIIALMRDGFHAGSAGGVVQLGTGGAPVLDYPITPYMWEGMRRALLTMAEIQFAAGAKTVMAVHEMASPAASWPEAKAQIEALPMEILLTRVVSAHVMGGCGMGSDPSNSVVDGNGRHHSIGNLYVFDGSIFPTSLSVNPQLSIYGIVARMANGLARTLTGTARPALV
jgi:choline dehydrogenase-like flavoprotein